MALSLAPTPREKLSAQINALIDDELQRQNAAEPMRDYLGGSIMGEECFRYLWFKMRVPEKAKPFEGRFVRRTRLGHKHESMTLEWMASVGFVFETDPAKLEWEVVLQGGRTAGHVDGKLLGGPIELPYPVVWEHKIMKAQYWRDFQRNGVAVAKPTYHAQCLIYTDRLKTNGALFTALNTDTSELEFEFVPPDPGRVNMLFMRADKVLAARVEQDVPRIAPVETDFRCKFCDFKEHCWREEADVRLAAPVKSFLPSWVKR